MIKINTDLQLCLLWECEEFLSGINRAKGTLLRYAMILDVEEADINARISNISRKLLPRNRIRTIRIFHITKFNEVSSLFNQSGGR